MRAFLHRYIWRRLPRGLRRAGLAHASAALAPRPGAGTSLQAPFFICGPFTMATGIGEGSRLCHDALQACGLEVMAIDLPLSHLDGGGPISHPSRDGSGHEGPGTVIIHVNAPHMALALTKLGRRFLRGKHIVGAWAWELPLAPASWRGGVRFVHEIWASSAYTAEALRPIVGTVPVKAVGYPAALRAITPKPEMPRQEMKQKTGQETGQPFRVLTMFDMSSSFARKNGLGAVEAFRRAFGDTHTAELVIKTARTSHFPGGFAALQQAAAGLNVRIIDADLPRAGIDALFAECDAVLSLHRAEGFGLLVAEGMLAGKPVIATGFSGPAELMDRETGFLTGFSLVPAADPQGVYDVPGAVWAEPDLQEAAETLQRLKDDPALARAIGIAAAHRAREQLSPERYCRSAGLIS
jgi:Glycosyl transferases group 1